MVAEVFHFYAGAVDKHHGETIPVAGGVDVTFREPLGVVGLIVPWNFPLNIASWKLGPALACGNTVVLKPAELTPLSALRLAELVLEAGVPEGVVNVLVGKGSVVGRRLVEHPDVAKIGFTGSTEVGREVMRGAAGTIKRVTLELGGKSANVDLRGRRPRARRRRGAVRGLRQRGPGLLRALAGSWSSGRPTTSSSSCSSTRRARSASAIRRDERTEMGPLISAEHREHGRALRRRRACAFSGEVPERTAGFWFPCTVVEASNDDRIAREEVFGPVAAVIPFADRGGRDPARQRHAVRALRVDLDAGRRPRAAGRARRSSRACSRSTRTPRSARQTPFGGFKQSGFGRELGHAGARRLLGGQERVPLDGGLRRTVARLDGKVCVITGAGGGMGREAAIVFAGEGARRLRGDVNLEAVEETVALCPEGERARRARGRRRARTTCVRCSPRRPSASAASTCSTTTPASRPATTPR